MANLAIEELGGLGGCFGGAALISHLQQIAAALEAGEDLTPEQRRALVEVLQPKPLVRFAERDVLLIEIRREFFHDRSDNDAAHEIAAGLRRYASSAWLRESSYSECPSKRVGTIQGAYWRLLRTVSRPLSPGRIREIVAGKSR